MVQAISFGKTSGNDITPNLNKDNQANIRLANLPVTQNDEKVQKVKIIKVKKEKDTGIFSTTVNSLANTQKFLVDTKEAISGGLLSVGYGLATCGATMGIDWLLQKCTGRGVKEQFILTTPIKTVSDLLIGTVEKVSKLFSKNTSFRKVLFYPVIGFPKDICKYISSAKGCSGIGKGIAITLGLGVFAYNVCKTILKINMLNAEIDHKFKIGHNNK